MELRAPHSEKQAYRYEAWRSAYMHLGTRAVTLNDLRLQGTAACVLQMIVTTTLPVVWYFLLYKDDSRLVVLPICTWAITAVTGCTGIAGFALLKSLLIGVHGVTALALAASLGVFDTLAYLLLADRCDRLQATFVGCGTCPCAAANSCTQAQLQGDAGCSGCTAWARDICDEAAGTGSIMPFMGLIELFFISLPTVFSFMVLMRLEKEQSDAANKATYARSVVLRELQRLEAARGLNVDLLVFKQLLTTVLRHGGSRQDRAAVQRCCALLNLDPESLAAGTEFDDGARNTAAMRDQRVGGAPSYKIGSVTMAQEEYLKAHSTFLNSSFVHGAPPGTPQLTMASGVPQPQAPPMASAIKQIFDGERQVSDTGSYRSATSSQREVLRLNGGPRGAAAVVTMHEHLLPGRLGPVPETGEGDGGEGYWDGAAADGTGDPEALFGGAEPLEGWEAGAAAAPPKRKKKAAKAAGLGGSKKQQAAAAAAAGAGAGAGAGVSNRVHPEDDGADTLVVAGGADLGVDLDLEMGQAPADEALEGAPAAKPAKKKKKKKADKGEAAD